MTTNAGSRRRCASSLRFVFLFFVLLMIIYLLVNYMYGMGNDNNAATTTANHHRNGGSNSRCSNGGHFRRHLGAVATGHAAPSKRRRGWPPTPGMTNSHLYYTMTGWHHDHWHHSDALTRTFFTIWPRRGIYLDSHSIFCVLHILLKIFNVLHVLHILWCP